MDKFKYYYIVIHFPCLVSFLLQEVYIVGGHVMVDKKGKGNVFTVPSNEYAEFNMFLDPLAAKAVLESNLDITLIPLTVQRQVSSFSKVIERLSTKKTPESMFAHQLLSRLHKLQQTHRIYHHMVILYLPSSDLPFAHNSILLILRFTTFNFCRTFF